MFWIYALSSLKIVWTVWLAVLCFGFPTTDKVKFIVLVILIVVSDVVDGRIAAWLKSNNAQRRLFDNFTDVIVTHVSYIAILYALSWSGLWYIPLFIRDAIMVLMGVKAAGYRIVVFPGIFHKLCRLALPISAIFMLGGYYGEIALFIALALFFVALADYYGYFLIMCHKARQNGLATANNGSTLNEAHLNSSFKGLKTLVSAQKLLPPARRSE